MSIYEKLLAIQTSLKAPKNQYNKFGEYYYRNLEDVLEAAKPILKRQKVTLIISDEIEEVGNRVYVVATAMLIDIEDGSKVSVKARARETEAKQKFDASQLTGSASSYARKYALNGLFCIDDTRDADSQKPPAEAKPEGITAKDIAALEVMAKRKGVSVGSIAKHYKVAALENMTKNQYGDAMKKLKEKDDANG